MPNGRLKPLSELATVKINEGEAQIERENLQSMGVISARLENRDLGSVMKDIQKNIAANVSLPTGYHIEYGGSYAEQQKSFKELLMISYNFKLIGVWSNSFFV
ncbi:MAG: efflux RND transporter permease subunit [Chitinophagaceae bacterium]